jgi:L-fucose mutarotase
VLKGIDPLLTPELLKVLAEMGHGDMIVVADANFTATTLAQIPGGGSKPLIQLPGAGIQRASEAILSLLPLGTPAEKPVAYMKVCDTAEGYQSALQREMLSMLSSREWAQAQDCDAVERFAFYDLVRQAYAIVLTSDLQPYGNFLFKKGVIGEPLRP